MAHKIVKTFFIIILMMSSGLAKTKSSNDPALELQINRLMIPLVKEDVISGSILIAKKGKVVFTKGYGLANREHHITNKPDTIFRIGSITKTFTAMAIMILVERKQLKLSDTVSMYINNYPRGDQIRIRHLLNHTSGIKNFVFLSDYSKRSIEPHSVDEVINWFKSEPLIAKPGMRFHYSNSNYVLLTRIIEIVSGKSYEDFLTANIFKPCGMNNTGVDKDTLILENRASGYTREAYGKVTKSVYQTMSFGLGHGALYSSVLDLFLWEKAIRDNKLISQTSSGQIFSAKTKPYSYGWSVGKIFGKWVFFHGGALSGFVSMMKRFIEDDILIVSLFNVEVLLENEISERITAIIFDKPWKPIFMEKLGEKEAKAIAKWKGIYVIDKNENLTIEIKNRGINVKESGRPSCKAEYLSDNKIFVKDMNAVIRFNVDKKTGRAKANVFQGLLYWSGIKK